MPAVVVQGEIDETAPQRGIVHRDALAHQPGEEEDSAGAGFALGDQAIERVVVQIAAENFLAHPLHGRPGGFLGGDEDVFPGLGGAKRARRREGVHGSIVQVGGHP